MPTISRQSDPSVVVDTSPDPATNAMPAPNREEKRWISLLGGKRAKQFAVRLKANARWLKQFLHGGR